MVIVASSNNTLSGSLGSVLFAVVSLLSISSAFKTILALVDSLIRASIPSSIVEA